MVSKAEDDYLRTLDEITARLKNTHGSVDEPCKSVKLDDKDECDNEDSHEHVKRPIA